MPSFAIDYPFGVDTMVALIASGQITPDEADEIWKRLVANGVKPPRTPAAVWKLMQEEIARLREEKSNVT